MSEGFSMLLPAGLFSERSQTKATDPQQAVDRLNAAWGFHAAPPRFVVGDLVTPRAGYSACAGEPHIVVELRESGRLVLDHKGDPARSEIRVLHFHGEDLYDAWDERWRYEPWIAPVAAPASEAEPISEATEAAAPVVDAPPDGLPSSSPWAASDDHAPVPVSDAR